MIEILKNIYKKIFSNNNGIKNTLLTFGSDNQITNNINENKENSRENSKEEQKD